MRYLLFLSASLIFALGLITIFSASSAEILDYELHQDSNQALIRQMIFALLGIFIAIGLRSLGYRRLFRLTTPLLVFFTFLLVLTFFPGVGREVNGSHRWISVFGLSFQPSEFVKYLVPMYFVLKISHCQQTISFTVFMKIILPLGIPLILILVEPNNGTVAVIVITLSVLFFLTRVPLKYWAMPILCFVFVGSLFAYNLPYVSARINVYLHPELDIHGKGHQPHQAKIAAGSGRLFGKGPGNSWQKLSYLPEAQNDYIAAIFGEEFGFIGILTLITLYMIIALIGVHIAFHAPVFEGSCLAVIVTFLISFQAFLNLGVVSGLLPSTGLNLPLFSQGGSSLVANIIGLSLLSLIYHPKSK